MSLEASDFFGFSCLGYKIYGLSNPNLEREWEWLLIDGEEHPGPDGKSEEEDEKVVFIMNEEI